MLGRLSVSSLEVVEETRRHGSRLHPYLSKGRTLQIRLTSVRGLVILPKVHIALQYIRPLRTDKQFSDMGGLEELYHVVKIPSI